jgi:hypothetical protein
VEIRFLKRVEKRESKTEARQEVVIDLRSIYFTFCLLPYIHPSIFTHTLSIFTILSNHIDQPVILDIGSMSNNFS